MSAPFSPANRVIARVAKHKKAHLHAVDSHNRRTKPIKNAVPGAYAGRIHGDPSKTLSQLVDERLAAVGMATGKGARAVSPKTTRCMGRKKHGRTQKTIWRKPDFC
jgi:hypothetical protein